MGHPGYEPISVIPWHSDLRDQRQPTGGARPMAEECAPRPTLGVVVSRAPRPARPPIFQHPWRLAITAGVLLIVLNLGILLFSQSDTRRQGRNYPNAVEVVDPAPGEIIRVADTVTADLRNDLTGVLLIDGAEVPEDQTERVAPLGQISFRPGPSKDLTKFSPGPHTATVLYWEQGKARPKKPGAFSWSFRAGA
jgi:hypothetical protein